MRAWKNASREFAGLVPDFPYRRQLAKARRRIETITDEAELDRRLQHATELFSVSDDDARRFLDTFEFAAPKMPSDPFSPAYARAQWDLYRRIARKDDYEVQYECTGLDVESALRSPYPYSTGSATQVAEQLAAWSFVVRALQLPPGSRLVEFGPGWGNLTSQFTLMGIETTAVEVDAGFAELLRRKAVGNAHLNVVQSEMLEFQTVEPFDAALFFESFHHCSDHRAMLDRLAEIVAVDGTIAFAAEPMGAMPYPWGLRLDGLSVFCTRQHGWLELGFRRAYFDEALRRAGWSAETLSSRAMGRLAHIVIARRMNHGRGD